jgi:hypothetical protein
MTVTETRTRVILLDPTGEVETREGTGAARAADLAGGTLGLLDNSMGWSHAVLDEVGAIFRARYGVAEIAKARRPNLSRPTPAPMLEELVRQADFVVAGCGV